MSGKEYGEALAEAVVGEVRAEMGRQKLLQSELAKRAGLYTSTLSRYLNGRHMPLGAFFAIAHALDIEPGELVDEAARRL